MPVLETILMCHFNLETPSIRNFNSGFDIALIWTVSPISREVENQTALT